MRRDMGSKNKVFQPKVPDGPSRNITPNGTVKDEGDQGYFSNCYFRQGNLGTRSVGESTRDGPTKGNRSGEGNDETCF